MEPITRACLAFVVGVAAAPWVGSGPWAGLAAVALLAALPRGGAAAAPGVLVALLLGLGRVGALPVGPRLRGEVVVLGERVGAATGRSGHVEVRRWRAVGEEWAPSGGRVQVDFGERPPRAGRRVLVWGKATAVGRRGLPGAPDEGRAAQRAGVRTRLRVRSWAPVDGSDRGAPAPATDPSGLLSALALGDRSGVPEHTTAVLRGTGTSHLLAISGFHVGVVAMLAMGAVGTLRRAVAWVRPAGLPPVELVAGVAAAWGYAWLAHAPLSAQRAAGLLLLGAVGRLMGRQVRPEPLLGLVAVVVLWTDPAAVSTPSFQLSFGAVVGLVRVGGPLQERLPGGRWRWLSSGVAATVAATVGTLPAAAWWFQELAPLSPVANLVALPLTSVVLVPAAAVATLAPAPWDGVGAWVGTHGAAWLVWLLEPLAVAPFRPAVGPTGSVVLWVALALLPARRGLAALLTVVALALRPVPTVRTVTFLAVGQGDATLVEHGDGRRWLVDGGPYEGPVAAWLRRRGLRRIDRLVATHNQRDHVAGLVGVVRTLRVGELHVSDHEGLGGLAAAARDRAVPVLRARELHPPFGFEGSPNDRSVVMSVGDLLLTGDIERAGEAEVAAMVRPHRVLKVPHHGSATSSSPHLLDAVRPALAVVSVGPGNPWGHPRPEVRARYAARGIRLLRTDRDGTIVLRGGRAWGWRPGHGWQPLDLRGPTPWAPPPS